MNMESNSYYLKDADINDMQLFFESYIGYTNSQIDIEAFSSLYEARMNESGWQLFVLMTSSSQKKAGCVALKIESELFDNSIHIDIAHLYVSPKYRKLNAADALYEFIEAQCKVLKAAVISVSCGINSTLNQRFYTRRKFMYVKKLFLKAIEI